MYLVIDTAKIPANPAMAHTRLSIAIAKYLDADLISTVDEVRALQIDKYKYYVIVGSAFYPEIALLEAELNKNKKAVPVWVNNEYSCSPNSEYARMIKDRESIVISNVVEEANKVRGYDSFHLLNLNCLLFDSSPRCSEHKKYGLIYFGTYRPGRRLYLQKYFQNGKFFLSSSKKNLRKFKYSAGCRALWCDKLNWEEGLESLNLFKYSLYIEDEYTHTHYNHLANRFYESLMCNCVQFFDASCLGTIEKSGYQVTDNFMVPSAEELEDKVNCYDFKECLKMQGHWKAFAEAEKNKVFRKIKEILK